MWRSDEGVPGPTTGIFIGQFKPDLIAMATRLSGK